MSCRAPSGQNLIDMGVEQAACDLHLHAEVELLKQSLAEKQSQLTTMETQCLRETGELEDSIVAWQDKYERLYESHKRVQKVNQSLEDKVLELVDNNTAERGQWTSDVAQLSVSLADANYLVSNLRREIERYKTDMNLAIQLLRCNSDNFSGPKITSLPKDVQTKLTAISRLDSDSESLAGERRASSNFLASSDTHSNVMYRVLPASESPPPGVCPFPPTAMVHSMRGVDAKIDPNQITPELMAKYLEEEILAGDRFALKSVHCSTCQCKDADTFHQKTYSIGTQTLGGGADANNSLCLRCNSNLNSPSRSSPCIMKVGDSPERKNGSVMANGDEECTVRKEELQVNPILGHHRRTDRTNGGPFVSNKKSSHPLSSVDGQQQVKSAASHSISSSSVAKQNGGGSGGVGGVVKTEQETNAGSFNNVLIKNIKMSEHMNKSQNRPRLCSIRISSEGTAMTNILLENADSGLLNCDTVVSIVAQGSAPVANQHQQPIEKQLYKKRSKYLDEELDDSREVIVCLDKRPAPEGLSSDVTDSPGNKSRALIELTTNSNNKTDSEKYRETHSPPSVAVVENGKEEGGGGESGEKGDAEKGDQSAFLLDDPVPVVESLHVMNMTSAGLQNANNNSNIHLSNNHTVPTATPATTTTNSLRQEQLDRVAVWVQKSNEQQNLQTTPSPPPHLLLHNRKCNHSELSGSTVSQLTTSPVSYSRDDVCIDIEDHQHQQHRDHNHQATGGAGGHGVQSEVVAAAEAASDPDNIAQMEYNVKQFLLKQNEWSISGGGGGSAVPLPGQVNLTSSTIGNIYSPSASSMSFTSPATSNNNQPNNLRTETNL